MGNVFLFAFFMVIVILLSIKHLDIRMMLNFKKNKFVVCKKLKMRRSKLKQIKNQFFFKKNMVSTLPFVFCFWSSNVVLIDQKLIILYEHLELNKKLHHWIGARFYGKKNRLYFFRKNKNKKTKTETRKKKK